jgi:NAD(P)-dependent dehydrogenase (short-subunit alcohol dehydrogenase family)
MLAEGSLAGRVALVTGGGTGLGKAMAIELSRLGAAVAVLGRRREPLEETVGELAGAGLATPADVRDPDAVAAAFHAAEESLGPVTTLVTTVRETSSSTPRTFRRTGGAPSSGSSSTGRSSARARSRAA